MAAAFKHLQFGGSEEHCYARLFFDNGYGVSVIRHAGTRGLFEACLLKGVMGDADPCVRDGLTDKDGLCPSYLTPADVTDFMVKIQRL